MTFLNSDLCVICKQPLQTVLGKRERILYITQGVLPGAPGRSTTYFQKSGGAKKIDSGMHRKCWDEIIQPYNSTLMFND